MYIDFLKFIHKKFCLTYDVYNNCSGDKLLSQLFKVIHKHMHNFAFMYIHMHMRKLLLAVLYIKKYNKKFN